MEPVPDDEQRAVIEAPLDDRIFVSAMPGTGKTFCIAQRISHLLRRDKLKAGQEILVLSFSRGAVKVLKERLADLDGNGAFVKAWTFDSFATGLLREHSPEGDDGWAKENYDRRIALVSEWLAPRSGSTQIAPELLAYLRDLKHLFIDEAQDLVGVRLDLVKGLISRTGCGVTIMGDTAQGIFNYLASSSERRCSHLALFKFATKELDPPFRVMTLEHPHRFHEGNAALALHLWRNLAFQENLDTDATQRALNEVMEKLPIIASIKELDPSRGSSAVLCRSNGEALCLSQRLWNECIPHNLRHSRKVHTYPQWIGGIAYDHGSILLRSQFDEKMKDRFPNVQDHETKWKDLTRCIELRSSVPSIDLSKLRSIIMKSRLPDWLLEDPPYDLTVSTIHRSKGQEFDNIVIVPRKEGRKQDIDPEEEARTTFVALTRSRRMMYRLNASSSGEVWKNIDFAGIDGEETFWYTMKEGIVNRMQISFDDAIADLPYAGSKSAMDMQEIMLNCVRIGDKAFLQKIAEYDERGIPRYLMMKDGNPIAEMSPLFNARLARILKEELCSHLGFPERISGLRIETIHTRGCSLEAIAGSGLGASGIWMAVGVGGLGKLDFA